jgi:hypothetical protein
MLGRGVIGIWQELRRPRIPPTTEHTVAVRVSDSIK